jgi:8-oxo-dGTP pyrophosphatase MutT (NUDIX family)
MSYPDEPRIPSHDGRGVVNNQLVGVAMAILYQQNKFLMQLRDNIPKFRYPAHWTLFGGHMEPGETPEIAVQREILEETGYTLPPTFSKFGCYPDERVMRHVFYAPLEVEFHELVLGEGWDMALISVEDIRRGNFYSQKAGEVRPLVPDHQQILLDFLNQLQKYE